MGKVCKWAIALIILVGCESPVYEGVNIYKNINPPTERSVSEDGYNYGKPWQCVEFVKRFYHVKLDHKMPNTWGHAISFYNPNIKSGKLNKDRGLVQYKNNGKETPEKYDLIVIKSGVYGHVAIVDSYKNGYVTIAQQNTRKRKQTIKLNQAVVGWLRIE
jgi:surface antigen|tara:strand:- start:2982 stop:3461 length:480 start_codon:yes stop_codon:yes gene_type:complete